MADARADLVRKMIAEGTSDDDIRATLKVYDAQRQQSAAPQQPKGDLGRFGGYKMIGDAVIGAGKAALNHPVKSLATAGGMAGVAATAPISIPAAIAAAGLGAAGGAALGSIRNAMVGGSEGPKTAGGVFKTMAEAGASGAAGQAIGAGAGKMLTAGGKLVYKAALRPSMSLQREFGDIAETGLKHGIPVSGGGLQQAEGQMASNAGKVKQLLAQAEQSGAPPLTTKEIAGEFGDVFKQGREVSQLGLPDPRPAVVGRLQDLAAKNPSGIALTRAQALKGRAQDLAMQAYKAQDLGHPINSMEAASNKALARGLRKGIEARVPEVGPLNAQTQELIGLARAVEEATRRNVPGVGSLRTLLGDFMPATASHVGLAANNVGNSGVLPASFRTALIAALSGSDY